ncbi:hypothetical protein ACHHV8_03835 [Paenibacillus sp. TAB 01]|uniref:hypothetical protein n=1 Tax=Paenibacillus sp. TAB 01 TaxID=3368988 RepID=UPI003751B291
MMNLFELEVLMEERQREAERGSLQLWAAARLPMMEWLLGAVITGNLLALL